jgi:glycosyltransferase involved in cell wall biosynthesis
MNTPLVSIIMPTYNRAHGILKSIYSVVCQDYQNWELIIIDDGSTDNTVEVVGAIDDPRIIYLKLEQNQGPAFARNVGISRAKGNFIALIDSDDIWLDKLGLQIDIMQRFPQIDILFGNYLNINHMHGSEAFGFDQTCRGLDALTTKSLSEDTFLIVDSFPRGLLISNFIAPSSVLMKSLLIEKVGNFCEGLRVAEDAEFWLRASINKVNYAYVTKILIERHKDQTSASITSVSSLNYVIKSLDIFNAECLKCNRIDLFESIRNAKNNTFQYMIKLNAAQGKRREAIQAFRECLNYGPTWRLFVYLGAALCGPSLINKAKRLKNFK